MSSLGAELRWVFAAVWTVLALLQFERVQFGPLLERQDEEARRIRPTSSPDAPAACDPA